MKKLETNMPNSSNTKNGILKNTEWIFAFNTNFQCEIPTLIRFETNKTLEEIKLYCPDNNYYDDQTGLAFVSIWYCDEYSKFYDYVGRKIANGDANYRIYNPDHEELQIIKLEYFPAIDLDKEFKSNKINETGDYGRMIW
jgi:hypothetical protein